MLAGRIGESDCFWLYSIKEAADKAPTAERNIGSAAEATADRQPSKARDPSGTYRDKHGTLRSEANGGVIIDRTEAQWKDSSWRVREMD